MRWQDLTTLTKSAVLSAILGFVIKMPFTRFTEISQAGETPCTHMDFAALCIGGVAMALGAAGAVKARDLTAGQKANVALCVLTVGFGFLHMLRGLGLVMSPCASL